MPFILSSSKLLLSRLVLWLVLWVIYLNVNTKEKKSSRLFQMLDLIVNSPFPSVAPSTPLCLSVRVFARWNNTSINSQNRKCWCSSSASKLRPTTVILINASRIIKWRRKMTMKITLKMRWPRMCQDRRGEIATEWKKIFFFLSIQKSIVGNSKKKKEAKMKKKTFRRQ